MGIITRSGSFTRYLTTTTLPEDFLGNLQAMIARYAFRDLDERSVDERSSGWVNILDMFDNQFPGVDFLKEPYVAMSLRIDERKIPPTALKQYTLQAETHILEEEQLEYLPRRRRSEIKDAVRIRLLKRAIPVSKTHDMIWNTRTGQVIFGCVSPKTCDEFTEIFRQTFDMDIQAVCPYTLAEALLKTEDSASDPLDELTPMAYAKEEA
ncbi:MAG: recombination-associated protein RdgC [Deltaproteobacteria bacterium]|nr:recombination-associated protein RdgC [Deltaproteobacteria bacterium]